MIFYSRTIWDVSQGVLRSTGSPRINSWRTTREWQNPLQWMPVRHSSCCSITQKHHYFLSLFQNALLMEGCRRHANRPHIITFIPCWTCTVLSRRVIGPASSNGSGLSSHHWSLLANNWLSWPMNLGCCVKNKGRNLLLCVRDDAIIMCYCSLRLWI